MSVQSDTTTVQPEDAISAPVHSESSVGSQKFEEHESHETVPAVNSYQIKPSLQDKFKDVPVKEIIRETVNQILSGKTYDAEKVKKWIITIANDVNEKVKDLQMKRYRHIVQVILGEMKGAGVKSGVRCVWDSDTDGYASDIFMNDTIFCVTTVFAVFILIT